MYTQPLVSVIIPTFNAQDTISETLDSILAQTYKNLEIIVVDDGSTDQTRQIIQSYQPRVSYYYQNNSGGCAVPRNTGIKHSVGDYLCFMDADDLMLSDRITYQVDFMERYTYVGLVFCDYRNFNEDGPYSQSHFQTCPNLWSQLKDQKELILGSACSYLAQENFGSAGSLLIRNNVLKIESGFEPTLKACEDFHFYYRLAQHVPLGVINTVGMLRRLHKKNMSSDSNKMLTAGIKSRTMLVEIEKNSDTSKYLNQYIARCHNALARYYANHGQYLPALQQDCLASSRNLCWNQLRITLRGIARTIILATGILSGLKSF